MQEWQISAIFSVWHGPCKTSGIAAQAAKQIRQREIRMTTFAQIGRSIAAAATALTLSLVLISGTVSVPSTAQAHGASAYVSVVA